MNLKSQALSSDFIIPLNSCYTANETFETMQVVSSVGDNIFLVKEIHGDNKTEIKGNDFILVAKNLSDLRVGCIVDFGQGYGIISEIDYCGEPSKLIIIGRDRKRSVLLSDFSVEPSALRPLCYESFLQMSDGLGNFLRSISRVIDSVETIECFKCQSDINEDIAYSYDGGGYKRTYCGPCAVGETYICYCCNSNKNLKENRKFYYKRNKFICLICYNTMLFDCIKCERRGLKPEGGYLSDFIYCGDCYSIKVNESLVSPPNSIGDSFLKKIYAEGNNFYKSNKSRTAVSLEIELISSDGDPDRQTPDGWSSAYDSSLSSGGIEFIMSPTVGDNLKSKLDTLLKWSKEMEFYTDKSCGIHVHTNALDMGVNELKGVLITARKLENFIYKMVPPERESLRYSRRMSYFKLDDLLKIETTSDFCKFWYQKINGTVPSFGKYNESRYRGLNMHARFLLGTIEYRYHEGSMDSDRIFNWAKFCLGITDFGKTLLSRDSKTIDMFLDDKEDELVKYLEVMDIPELEGYLKSRIVEYREEREKKRYEQQQYDFVYRQTLQG
jgi:hypothetical protein